MLVLSRKPGERVRIGTDITVTLVEVQGNRVKLGVEAPDSVRVLRGELPDWQIEVIPARASRSSRLAACSGQRLGSADQRVRISR